MELCREVGVSFEAVAKEVGKLNVAQIIKLMLALGSFLYWTSSKLYK